MSRKRKNEEEDIDYDTDFEPVDTEEILKSLDGESLNNFRMVREQIKRTEPSIKKILKEPFILEDRTKLFQMFEIYQELIPNTDCWLEYRDKFNRIYQECQDRYVEYAKVPKKEHDRMDREEAKFKTYDSHLSIRQKILSLDASRDVIKSIYRRYEEFSQMKPSDDEYLKAKIWLRWAINIPHNRVKKFPYKPSKITKFLNDTAIKMDSELYGMRKVKEQLLVFLNAKLLNPSMKGCSLGLLGPPGVGKTAISRLLASIMEYPFEQISLGGITTAEYLKGHDFTYVGSQPGEIVKCLRKMQYKNGIIYFDEYEKASKHPDVKDALLHITDYGQNEEYRDSYLSEIVIDLSEIWFIYSMNNLPEDPALRDRIFYIEVPGYDLEEKIEITRNYILPKCLANSGLPGTSIQFKTKKNTEYFLQKIRAIDVPGVRQINKIIADIVMKISFIVAHQEEKSKFNLSFLPKEELKYPVILTQSVIDSICQV